MVLKIHFSDGQVYSVDIYGEIPAVFLNEDIRIEGIEVYDIPEPKPVAVRKYNFNTRT